MSHSGNAISDTITSLSSGSSAVFTFTAQVGTSVADGTVLSNTASASSSTADPVSGNNGAAVNTTVNAQADLAVTETGSSTAIAGNQITYTITLTNNGPSDSQSVTLSDSLPAGLTYVSQSQTSGTTLTLSHSGNTISDTVSTLTASASATITITAAISASVADGTVVSNVATASASTTDPTSSNNGATVNTTVSAANRSRRHRQRPGQRLRRR